ncbi:uncharacterized protein LOC143827414 [Paroedura picta]|uniref:uncharacterized protein LOC143827414 n=1 Tax=Paroedura picta TaxID=143630 RepID=UPI004055CAC0
MLPARSASFLLAFFGFYLGLSLETASEEGMVFFGDVAEAYDSRSPSKLGSPARRKRATESCQSGPITNSTLEDPLFVVLYDSLEQFDACLSNAVLAAHLAPLLGQPLPDDYLAVIRRRLDEIYPGGIPDDQLKRLSYLARLYSPEEITKWKVTSGETLATLLSPEGGPWKPDQLKQLISTYMGLGGQLTGPLLSILGGVNLCLLEAGQLAQISPESLGQAEKLDVSSCSQDKKDILYGKARAAFASQEGTSAYYPLIQPYLGGAPVEDLRRLARSQVAMDIHTFTDLKPEELKRLSVQDVTDLLVGHLPGLRDVENHTSVAAWIKSQLQSELDTLGIGLRGGRMGPTGSTGAEGPPADTPPIVVSPAGPTAVTAVSPVSTAAITDASPTRSPDTSMSPLVAPDSFTTPLLQATPAADAASASTENAHATAPGGHSEGADPTRSLATSDFTATSEDAVHTAGDASTIPTSTAVASRDVTPSGTILDVGRGVDTATPTDPTVASNHPTTDRLVLPSVAPRSHTTPSGNTTAASASGRTARTVPVASSPIGHINRTSATPNVTTTAPFEGLPMPPIPLPEATLPASPSTPPATSGGETPAASRRTTVHSSSSPGQPRSTVVAKPEGGVASGAPPKTKQPSHPTPNGYINLKPLNASAASSSSLSSRLLASSTIVGFFVLRRLF